MNIFDELTESEIKKMDNGSILFMSKIPNAQGDFDYLVSLNIYPYSARRVPKETFEEWTKFCNPVSRQFSQVEGEHWKIKPCNEV